MILSDLFHFLFVYCVLLFGFSAGKSWIIDVNEGVLQGWLFKAFFFFTLSGGYSHGRLTYSSQWYPGKRKDLSSGDSLVQQAQLQWHRFYNAGVVQVHHWNGKSGIHRSSSVQRGFLHPSHLLHHSDLHPDAEHAHRTDGEHGGADLRTKRNHLEPSGKNHLQERKHW